MVMPFEKSPVIINDFTGSAGENAHPGIDIIPNGSEYADDMDEKRVSIQNAKRMITKVKSITKGKVVWANKTDIAGLCIAVDTKINGSLFRFLYCKLGRIYVYKNSVVKKGQIIARVGDLPDKDLHLHLSVIKNPPNSITRCFYSKNLIDPKTFFKITPLDNGRLVLSLKSNGKGEEIYV